MSPEERALYEEGLRVADCVSGGLAGALAGGVFSPAGVVAGLTYALHQAFRAAAAAGHDLTLVDRTVERLAAAVEAAGVTKGTMQ